ncbi:MAG: TIGR03564 family F420-dependent LLM class oxidoreductase [Acidimicrobiales bacterium]
MSAGDRLGVRWGLAGGVAIASVAEARRVARYANDAGFDGLWISHSNAVDPVVTLACVADETPALDELGTSVTPIYGRHPIGLAQLARTAQSALGGRFTLGIGASSKAAVATNMGLDWDRPLGFTREFIDGLQPLLAGRAAEVVGEQLTARAELAIDATDTPILLAALGPRMLELAGQRVEGTSVGQCGPRTIADYVAPTIGRAAGDAGRPTPRIMALIRLCVAERPADHEAALDLARSTAERYRTVPSYARVQDVEGLDDLAGLFLIGSWERVLDGLGRYAEAGVTDFRLEVAAPDEATAGATRAALADHLGGPRTGR